MNEINDLTGFVKFLAGQNQNPDCVGMEYDDLISELLLELVKSHDRYKDLPEGQYKAIMRRICDNRISELKYRHYVTHRKESVSNISLDLEIVMSCRSEENVVGVVESNERVAETRKRLSPTSQLVFDAVIVDEDEVLANIFKVAAKRSTRKPSDILKTWQVAEATGMEVKAIDKAFREIKRAYREVSNV
jgi:hypothetical protein